VYCCIKSHFVPPDILSILSEINLKQKCTVKCILRYVGLFFCQRDITFRTLYMSLLPEYTSIQNIELCGMSNVCTVSMNCIDLLTIHRNIATCMTHSVSSRKVRKCVWLSQTNLLKNDARFPRLSFSSQQCVLVFLFAAYLNGAIVNTKCLRYFFLHRDCQWTFILRLGGQCVLMTLYNVRYIGANCNIYFLLLFLEV